MENFESKNVIPVGLGKFHLNSLLLQVDLQNLELSLNGNVNHSRLIWKSSRVNLALSLKENIGFSLETPFGNLSIEISNEYVILGFWYVKRAELRLMDSQLHY